MDEFDVLREIQKTINSRKDANPDKSYVAKLFHKGRKKIAQKVGEEAVELVIDAIYDNKKNAISESADLLFHLFVLWSDMEIGLQDICDELEERRGISGLEEKLERKNKKTKK